MGFTRDYDEERRLGERLRYGGMVVTTDPEALGRACQTVVSQLRQENDELLSANGKLYEEN